MFRRLIFPLLVLILVLAGGVYVLNNIMRSPSISSSQNPSTNTQLSELDNGWGTYVSEEWKFAINHPLDVKIELTQNGVHFLKPGPTQSTGTELFDGLSLLIYTSALINTDFEEFVQNEYAKVKKEPLYESVTPLEKTTVSTYSGYKFSTTGLGKGTTYFLNDGVKGYIKVTDMTVEPANANRDFHETVTKMLASLQRTILPTQITPSGTDDQLTAAVRDFAAHDFNTSPSSVTFVSIQEHEWSNGCLGLEQPGEMCTQVITPGYEITVQANGKQKVYRTNADGSIIKVK